MRKNRVSNHYSNKDSINFLLNKSASLSFSEKRDLKIESTIKSLKISNPFQQKIPAKPALKPKNSNRKLSPFKLLDNEEDQIKLNTSSISEQTKEADERTGEEYESQISKNVRQKRNLILSYLKKNSDLFNYLSENFDHREA